MWVACLKISRIISCLAAVCVNILYEPLSLAFGFDVVLCSTWFPGSMSSVFFRLHVTLFYIKRASQIKLIKVNTVALRGQSSSCKFWRTLMLRGFLFAVNQGVYFCEPLILECLICGMSILFECFSNRFNSFMSSSWPARSAVVVRRSSPLNFGRSFTNIPVSRVYFMEHSLKIFSNVITHHAFCPHVAT